MKNPVQYLLRLITLKRNGSRAPHGLCPLGRIRSATVLLDSSAEDFGAVLASVKRYFDAHNIPVHILAPAKGDFDLLGTLKKRFRGPRAEQGSGELFISLVDSPESFYAEYEARCSRACFKLGRRQLPGDIFDMVVLAPENSPAVSQSAVFEEIKNYLNIIR